MFTQHRRRSNFARRCVTERNWRGNGTDFPHLWMLVGKFQSQVLHLGIFKHFRDGVDGSIGDIELLQPWQPVAARLRFKDLRKRPLEFLVVGHSILPGTEPRVLAQVGPIGNTRQSFPELGWRRQVHGKSFSIRTRKGIDLSRTWAGIRSWNLACGKKRENRLKKKRQSRREHTHLNSLASAGLFPGEQGPKNSITCEYTGHAVRERRSYRSGIAHIQE